ncbi:MULTISPECIES: DNA-binding response regulator [unclassified Streptomyces]|uniref:response regulator transcription factor n=1 Tax=unclassified Streptomyces TaxID=2593676 RepID=UPI00224E19AD|nr:MULTISPECIES: response regulator transcription factor [unclassified Streptomyces]MCX4527208.1 response regulator transcription factor [Streptomyces sp. NBC_01551]MCX4542216.1 response regulator transcription factor [Streptomyces sp. NBC_01565]
MERRRLRILLAEDMHMVRGALVALLELEPDLEVVAVVDRGDLIVPTAMKCRPDVAIMDVDLPNMDGLTAAEALHDQLPECRTLIMTGLGRPGLLRRAMSARVTGFLLKDSPSEGLAQAVREVAAGRRVINPQLAMSAWDIGDNPLSDRETEVLSMAAQGDEPREIAAKLHLSIGTVRNYLTTTVVKLNARNRIDAVRIATEAGWLA